MRITLSLLSSFRGDRPTPASAAARHWQSVNNQLSPLLAGAMSLLYSSLFRASLRTPKTATFISALRAVRLNQGALARHYTASSNMSDLFVELTAPNGHKYRQPRGLFINNEFVKSKSGETITSINPRYKQQTKNTSFAFTDCAMQR